MEDLTQAGLKKDEGSYLASSYCFLQVLKLYAESILESLERLFNLKPLFQMWQKQYSREAFGKSTESEKKANTIMAQIKEQGGMLKPILDQVLTHLYIYIYLFIYFITTFTFSIYHKKLYYHGYQILTKRILQGNLKPNLWPLLDT